MKLIDDRSPTGPTSNLITRLTPRQERFCHSYVQCANAAGGAREAGYEARWAKQQGRRLLTTTRIQVRIREIHVRMAEVHGRNTDSLIGKLEVVYRRSLENHQFYAAVRAVELQAKLSAGTVACQQPLLIEGNAQEGAAPVSGQKGGG